MTCSTCGEASVAPITAYRFTAGLSAMGYLMIVAGIIGLAVVAFGLLNGYSATLDSLNPDRTAREVEEARPALLAAIGPNVLWIIGGRILSAPRRVLWCRKCGAAVEHLPPVAAPTVEAP